MQQIKVEFHIDTHLNPHLEVARGPSGLGDGGVGCVGGVEVSLDCALGRMLDLEEALGEALHLQV